MFSVTANMSRLMRALARYNTVKPPGLQIFFSFLLYIYIFFFWCECVSRPLITITRQHNQFPRQRTLGQTASGLGSAASAGFSMNYQDEDAGNLPLPHRGQNGRPVSLQEFDAR